MKKMRIMMLVHSYSVPPDDLIDENDPRLKDVETEFDVKNALEALGHEVQFVPIDDDITPIRKTVEQWQPHIAFNLLEDFAGNSALDYYVVSYLDMLKVPYTGCNPRGLLLCRDKALSKKILTYHRIKVPAFHQFVYGKKINDKQISKLPYPMIIKSLIEEGSMAIAQASYVTNAEELRERVEQVHNMTGGDAIAEQYIEGRELYVGVLGNQRLQVLPVRELIFGNVDDNMPRMATYKVKWDEKYRERWGIDWRFAYNLPQGVDESIVRLAKRVYRALDITGYARLDLRLNSKGEVYIIEANPNPAIASNDDVALSAEKAGMDYHGLIKNILNLGLRARRIV